MYDFNDVLRALKQASLDAVNASNPVQVVHGTVTEEKPLKIKVEQKLTLSDAQLVLTRNVSDYKTNMTINGSKSEVTIHNKLTVGDKVLMIRVQGGQKYIVMDRVVE